MGHVCMYTVGRVASKSNEIQKLGLDYFPIGHNSLRRDFFLIRQLKMMWTLYGSIYLNVKYMAFGERVTVGRVIFTKSNAQAIFQCTIKLACLRLWE